MSADIRVTSVVNQSDEKVGARLSRTIVSRDVTSSGWCALSFNVKLITPYRFISPESS